MKTPTPRPLRVLQLLRLGARTAAPIPRRALATKPPSPPPPEAEVLRKQSRLDRTVSRLPRFLQKHVSPLRAAPITHMASFLLLHELTAVVPLVGLAGFFHYANWLPPYVSEGAWVKEGAERFGRYFRRKGWIADEEGGGGRGAWAWGEGAVRVVVEVGTAWAITKALLPARLVLSVWATPWFARVFLVPVTNGFRRFFGRAPKSAPSPAAGTGSTSGGVLPKGKR